MTDKSLILRDALGAILLRDLRSLDRQIAAYPDDASLWIVAPGISNSAGTLAQHICGNLRHFVGAVLVDTGYVRNRDAEFSERDRTRADLRADIATAIEELHGALASITGEMLSAPYPLPLAERRVPCADFMIHLVVHLGYHLGQIDYHRRLVTASKAAVNALSIRELREVT